MAITTTRPEPPAINPLDALRLDEGHAASPAGQRARRVGLLEAKAEAHRAAARLARWARPLAIATTAVSRGPAGGAALTPPE